MSLPRGWYPEDKAGIEDFLHPFLNRAKENPIIGSSAVISPHAGWYFCGALAALAISSLDPKAETIAVIGGHLGGNMPPLAASEEAVRTPLGLMKIDRELLGEFKNLNPTESDNYRDNTVEVLLPMVQYFFPSANLVWLRFPASISSFEYGKSLYKAAKILNRKLVIIASADLTHYGINYGFTPKGTGKLALQWVKNINDRALIDAILERDPDLVLKRANEDHSTCSAGPILGALGFANNEKTEAKLLKYGTSADLDTGSSSFVGYAAISL